MTVTTHIMTEKISKEKLLNKLSINITYRTKQHLDTLHSHVMDDDSKISDYGDFVYVLTCNYMFRMGLDKPQKKKKK